ncbi:sulfatase-like hydrolase/transferase [Halovulum sp. GXIMD14794]
MSRPNVIIFFTDQQRFDTTGAHGNPMGLTPNFDRLAGAGTHFANAFTVQPVCGPARASLQTGRYPTEVGCWRNGRPLPKNATTMARVFQAAGYDTGYIGKWHLSGEEPVPADERGGHDFWRGANLLEFVSDAYDTVLFDEKGDAQHLPGYRVDAMTDEAIRYVSAPREAPYFLTLSFLEPHHQNHVDAYPAPDGWAEACPPVWSPPDLTALGGSAPGHLQGYYGMVKRLDEALGRLMDALRSTGQLENTIVLFLSDHGCHFKTRNAEYKRSCHEASIRVPMMATGPGFEGGGRVEGFMSLIDVAPTLLDAVGLDVPEAMQGRSILPLLTNRRAPWREDLMVQISESQTGRALRTKRWKYAIAADPELEDQGASDRYMETELYDLAHDPYELVNLAGQESHAELSAHLRDRLLVQIEAVEGAAPKITPAPPLPTQGQRRVGRHEFN